MDVVFGQKSIVDLTFLPVHQRVGLVSCWNSQNRSKLFGWWDALHIWLLTFFWFRLWSSATYFRIDR